MRLLQQALRALGYVSVATQLERESGIQQAPRAGTAFSSAVARGDYMEALRLLPAVSRLGDSAAGTSAPARYLLLRQHYLELVQRGATTQALQVLRHELQPLLRAQQAQQQQQHEQVLHSLAALLLQSPAAAAGSSGGDGGGDSSQEAAAGRDQLLAELQGWLLPSLIIPERRLEELVEQALVSQLERSPYHNSRGMRLSLFSDCVEAGPEQLPGEGTAGQQVLEEHSSEVWCLAFSPDGLWAASGGRDDAAVVWAVDAAEARLLTPRRFLHNDTFPCHLLAFSPDSRLLLTASHSGCASLFDVRSGKRVQQFNLCGPAPSPNGSAAAGAGGMPQAAAMEAVAASAAPAAATERQQQIVALSWFPDSSRFLVATHKQLLVLDARQSRCGVQAPLARLSPAHSFLYDAVVGPGGSCVISVGCDNRIAFYRWVGACMRGWVGGWGREL